MCASPGETTFHDAILDVVHDQWAVAGAPFARRFGRGIAGPVDPEALPIVTQRLVNRSPRLAEALAAWDRVSGRRAISTRATRLSDEWRSRGAGSDVAPADPVVDPRYALAGVVGGGDGIILRTRSLLGRDCRHMVLVHLIASRRAARAPEMLRWIRIARNSMRSALANLVDSGFVRRSDDRFEIVDRTAWETLLGVDAERIVLVDWNAAFRACIDLVSAGDRARDEGVAWNSGPMIARRRDCVDALNRSIITGSGAPPESLVHLIDVADVR